MAAMKDITDLKENQSARVYKITAPEPLRSRLLGMGILKGAEVLLKNYTFSKKTYEVEIGRTNVALREEEAKGILIK